MHRRTILAVAAALALLSRPALAPTETEPNDDPTDPGYAGALSLGAAPAADVVTGDLSASTDLDILRLDAPLGSGAMLLVAGFTPPIHFQASHGDLNAALAKDRPYSFRGLFGFPIHDFQGAPHYASLGASEEAGANPYTLTIVRPGLLADTANVKAVFKPAAASDSFTAKLSYDPATTLGPGSGGVTVLCRDFAATVSSSAFTANSAGTVFKYKGDTGVRKIVWNAGKGTVSIKAAGIDFPASPAEGSLPVAIYSGLGGVGVDLDGSFKAGARSSSAKARKP